MYKNKRFIGILLVLITIMTWIFPTIKVLAEGTGEIKADSKLEGVTYKLNPDVVKMPSGINYEIEEEEKINYTEYDETIEDESNKEIFKRKVSIPSDKSERRGFLRESRKGTGKIPTTFNREEPDWNKTTEFTPTSITVDSQTVKKLSPEIGKTYFDPVNQTTFKVIDKPTTNSAGLTTIPVEKPEISEIITDVNIPKQTIELTEDDISYLHPDLSRIETSSSQVTQIASKDGFVPSTEDHWIKINLDGLTLIDEGTDIKNAEEAEERKKEAEKDVWRSEAEKKQFEEEEKRIAEEQKDDTKFSANVRITDGYIKIFKPELSTSLEWDNLMFYADAKANIDIESDIIIEGDIRIYKEVEILIQGFEVDFEIGKIACGIYLVLGVDGKVSFDVRVQQQGTITIGAAARGVLIPMVVYPFVDYDNSAYESQVILNGQLKLWALAMPKVSLHILDWEILDARFKVGVEANAIFNTNPDESETFKLWIDLLLELRLKVIALKEQVPFETRITLYERTKTRSKDESGTPIDGGTEGGFKAKGFVLIDLDKMDAVRDIIRGSITIAETTSSPPISCTGEEVLIEILHVDGTITEHKVSLEEYGEFYLSAPITPLDMVSVSYDKVDIKYDYSSKTPFMNIQLPYKVNSLFADAFNEKIIGEIDGEIYGPNEIALDGDEVRYSGDIYVKLSGNNNSVGRHYTIQQGDDGQFTLGRFPLTNTTLVSAGLVFEDARIETEFIKPELGLSIHYGLIESDDKQSFTIIGAIQNINGDKLYKGNVKLYGGNGQLYGDVKAQVPGEVATVPNNIGINPKPTVDIKPTLPGELYGGLDKEIPSELTPKERINNAIRGNEDITTSTIFEFKVPLSVRQVAAVGGASIVIEHNGTFKKVNVISKTELPQPPVLEKAVVSPLDAIIDSRINPAMGKDMKPIIDKQSRIYQDSGANIDINQVHGVLYSLVQTPLTQSGVYSFKEDSLKLNALGEKGGIALSWNTNLDTTNIEGYRIYKGIASGAEELVPITGTVAAKDNKYLDTNVIPGTIYYYLCSVVYKNGDEFIISNEVMMSK